MIVPFANPPGLSAPRHKNKRPLTIRVMRSR
jgi:hypothetical protein